MSRAENVCTRAACRLDVAHPQRGEPCRDEPPARSASYDLGRARGIVTGRAEPTERDEEWLSGHVGAAVASDDVAWPNALADFAEGTLDGRDQATSRKLGLPCPDPPPPEALAAARVAL